MSEKKKKDIPQEPVEENTAPEQEETSSPEDTCTVTRQQMEQFESLAKLVSEGNDNYLRLAATNMITIASAPRKKKKTSTATPRPTPSAVSGYLRQSDESFCRHDGG